MKKSKSIQEINKKAGRPLDQFSYERNEVKTLRSDARKLETIAKKFGFNADRLARTIEIYLKNNSKDKEFIDDSRIKILDLREKIKQLNKMIKDMRVESELINEDIKRRKAFDVDEKSDENHFMDVAIQDVGKIRLFTADEVEQRKLKAIQNIFDDGVRMAKG